MSGTVGDMLVFFSQPTCVRSVGHGLAICVFRVFLEGGWLEGKYLWNTEKMGAGCQERKLLLLFCYSARVETGELGLGKMGEKRRSMGNLPSFLTAVACGLAQG